ncbi:uncharacterized protein LOC118440316 [Vespa mandarinia]|uniref:uncharacterized protein LOC118440316 n=1 Tax=Vespa mandarinia TaxID=7446 RepID=UPI00161EE69C|nr:uncharacterized protein LOC118440316 [Vespa mandarinia]
MRKFTGWPIICLTIILAEDTIADLNVSSKIDLDSNEIQLTSSDRPVIVSNQRERIVDVQKEPSMIRINEQPNPWLHRSTQSFLRSSFPEDLRKRRTHLSSGSATNTPNTVVNNVRIFVNENETEKGSNVASCENGVCDVSVSSKIDDEGNIVTDIHITIITNTKPNIEVAEIPVIDGFRGIEENIPRPSSPVFHPLDHVKPTFAHFLRNDIPQVQVHGFVEPNNGEIHFQDRRNYGRIFPTIYRWYNGNNHEQRGYNKGFQDSRSWLPRRVIVDDKIEAPLSKTKQSEK